MRKSITRISGNRHVGRADSVIAARRDDPFTEILIRHQAVSSIMVPSTVLIRQWLAASDSSRRAQVERRRAMHFRAFAKAAPTGSENSPGMTILSMCLLAAEKTRRQDGREGA